MKSLKPTRQIRKVHGKTRSGKRMQVEQSVIYSTPYKVNVTHMNKSLVTVYVEPCAPFNSSLPSPPLWEDRLLNVICARIMPNGVLANQLNWIGYRLISVQKSKQNSGYLRNKISKYDEYLYKKDNMITAMNPIHVR